MGPANCPCERKNSQSQWVRKVSPLPANEHLCGADSTAKNGIRLLRHIWRGSRCEIDGVQMEIEWGVRAQLLCARLGRAYVVLAPFAAFETDVGASGS
jgi:hypothetical protein